MFSGLEHSFINTCRVVKEWEGRKGRRKEKKEEREEEREESRERKKI